MLVKNKMETKYLLSYLKMRKIIFFQILILILIIFIFEFFDLDFKFQNLFFNQSTKKWLLNKEENKILHLIFYDGIKILIILFGVVNLGIFIFSYFKAKLIKFRFECLYIVLCLAVIPSVIALIKSYSNVYCPYELEIYNGDKPYIKTFEKMSAWQKRKTTDRGKGYPAGHASGGFALLCLFYVFKKRKHQILGLFIGLVFGWIMGIYQVLRGAHFLSHNFMTWLIAIISMHFIYILLANYFWAKKYDAKN